MHAYVASLKRLFEQNANPEQAAPMKKYMRASQASQLLALPTSKMVTNIILSKHPIIV